VDGWLPHILGGRIMNGIHNRIISNLKERVHGINVWATISGIEDKADALIALQELMDDGRVVQRQLTLRHERGTVPLYQLAPKYRATMFSLKS
jgi:hypothetical protein